MRVVYFHRKPIPNFHFSVEIIFNDVRRALPNEVEWDVITSSYFSKGFWPRIYNIVEAFLKRGEINHVTGDINYIGMLLPRKRTIHTILDCVTMTHSTGLKRIVFKLLWLTIPSRKCKFITTISEVSKSEIVFHTGCDPAKVKVIPIALSPVYRRVERVYQWNKPRILMVGSAPNKNTIKMLEAIKGIDCSVQIVGRFESSIKQYLLEHGFEHTYESGLNVEQMYAKYQKTDILLFASTYEGFGMPIIEAQATGTPVVTSNVSSMPEVAGMKGAVFVDPSDVSSIRAGVKSLIEDTELREQCISQGFENVKRFDAGRIAQMYVELYRQI